MRIIGGTLGGRKITPPSKMPHTRPTTDIAKEGLFNILENNFNIEGIKALDMFGGTGSISYEMASRGAADITIIEKDHQMYEFIKKTIKDLGLQQCHVVKSDVFRFLKHCSDQFDFIFAGPPYALSDINEIPKLVVEKQLLKNKAWFVLEHTPKNSYQAYPFYATERNYGTTVFSIFVNK